MGPGVNRLWAPGVLCTSTLCKRGGGGGVNSLWALGAGARHVLDFDARVRTREKALAVREVGGDAS